MRGGIFPHTSVSSGFGHAAILAALEKFAKCSLVNKLVWTSKSGSLISNAKTNYF
jgi:hypothetical protein